MGFELVLLKNMEITDHQKFMDAAIEAAKLSVEQGGFPVGAVIVYQGSIIATGISNGKLLMDASHHAEINALRQASKILGRRNLNDVTLYSSLEPCIMCLIASYWAKIPTVVYGCGKQRVSRQNYESDLDIHFINGHLHKPRNLIHHQQSENAALDVITSWEQSLKPTSAQEQYYAQKN